MVQSLGFAIYRALDWGLDESEERELSPQLEQLIDLMTNSDSEDSGCGTADEGYGGQEEEEEAAEGPPRAVRTFGQAMRACAARLTHPHEAQAHYQAVCRALFVETVELKAFLAKIRDAKEMLKKLKDDEGPEEKSAADLDNLRNTDWARLWVQLMRELRHGVKLKKVQEKQFNPLPTEYQLTPFEMLMQDIRARNYKLRKVMVDGDIPPRVKKDAHELILDFIRSRPPLKQASERRLRPMPQRQRTLHEKILEEIKQERKLRPVETRYQNQKGFGSLPCIVNACSSNVKSSSCLNLSLPDTGPVPPPRPRPRVLLKAPTLAEMEEMNSSEEEESPRSEARPEPGSLLPLTRDRSFSEQDLAQFQSEAVTSQPGTKPPGTQESDPRPRSGVQPPRGEPGADRGGDDQCAQGAGEGRDGEVPAEQGALPEPAQGQDLLLLPSQVPAVLLACQLPLLQEVCLQLLQPEDQDALQEAGPHPCLCAGLRERAGDAACQDAAGPEERRVPVSAAPSQRAVGSAARSPQGQASPAGRSQQARQALGTGLALWGAPPTMTRPLAALPGGAARVRCCVQSAGSSHGWQVPIVAGANLFPAFPLAPGPASHTHGSSAAPPALALFSCPFIPLLGKARRQGTAEHQLAGAPGLRVPQSRDGGDYVQPDVSCVLQLPAGKGLAGCGAGVSPHLHPRLSPQGCVQRLHQLRG
uniref:Spire type actin nucleation factor 2 n=1 Tax=Crocodylus porosus TaxID=8502 RepID=A0A7M4EMI1_CROPO